MHRTFLLARRSFYLARRTFLLTRRIFLLARHTFYLKTHLPADMIVAEQKRQENIVEYLLYMWQVEDLIRANALDSDRIRRTLVARYDVADDVRERIGQWYDNLADMMRSEGVAEHGHLQINRNVVILLNDLHLSLLRNPQETTYGALYYKALPSIVRLRAKSGGAEMTEIETCLTALYGYLMLRLQGAPVSPETLEAVREINLMLTFLAEKYKEERDITHPH